MAWIRSIVQQCAAASVPCYVKQLGREAQESDAHQPCVKWGLDLADRKGADPEEWPEDLRVRQFPEVRQ